MKINEIEDKFNNSNYGEFKRCVDDIVCDFLEKIQFRYREILDSGELDKILDDGANRVRELAKLKYEDMKKKIGLCR